MSEEKFFYTDDFKIIELIAKFGSKSSLASKADVNSNYVQLKRVRKLCTVKCEIYPDHKLHQKI